MVLLILLSPGCTSDSSLMDFKSTEPIYVEGCLSVAPDDLWFGPVEVGRGPPRTESVTLSNDCAGDLEIDDLTLSDPRAYRYEPPESYLVLPGGNLQLAVTFDPTTHYEGPGALVIVTSNGAVSIPLYGEGIAPVLVVDPLTELPWGPTGCPQEGRISVANGGSAALEITPLELSATTSEFALGQAPLPVIVAPGEENAVVLDYLPLDAVGDVARLQIVSNDPLRPEVAVAATGNGTTDGLVRETFEVRGDKVDVVWTLDRSGSTWPSIMAAVNMGAFRDALHQTGSDYHIAVAVEDDGCFLGEHNYVDDTFSSSEAEEILWTMSDLYLELGSYGSNTERGFTLAQAAVSEENTQEGGCNEGFLRDEAGLVIIHTSDEPEQSLFSWEEYVPWLQGLKDDPHAVRVHAAAGDVPGGCGHASPGHGYWEATVATGGLFLSGCTWGGLEGRGDMYVTGMELFAKASRMPQSSFPPHLDPVPETLEVKVDGESAEDWEWEPDLGLVVFEEGHLPEQGSTVEISYRPLQDCAAE